MIPTADHSKSRHRCRIGARRLDYPATSMASMILLVTALVYCRLTDASSAAGTETLVGIVGKDFVLLGADSSVSQSIALTASNLDKIAPLVDPFPDADTRPSPVAGEHQQQAIIAAAAGDTADSDRLLSYLKAIGGVEEYSNGGLGSDVRWVSLDDDNAKVPTRSNPLWNKHGEGLDVQSMAHLARRCIWERMRSRTPYRICLLIAGMMQEKDASTFDGYKNPVKDVERDTSSTEGDAENSNEHQVNTDDIQTRKAPPTRNALEFTSQTVQKQVRQAWGTPKSKSTTTRDEDPTSTEPKTSCYRPHLYWLDEYGSLQKIQYGAHGHGSNFLLSILDQGYRPDLTQAEAIELMNDCFRELRSRYVINSPEAPCIKCVDSQGIRWVPHTTTASIGKSGQPKPPSSI